MREKEEEEEARSTSFFVMHYKKRGEGKTATFKGNNGDIVTWNQEGNIVTVEDHVQKVTKTRKPVAKRMYNSNLDGE